MDTGNENGKGKLEREIETEMRKGNGQGNTCSGINRCIEHVFVSISDSVIISRRLECRFFESVITSRRLECCFFFWILKSLLGDWSVVFFFFEF